MGHVNDLPWAGSNVAKPDIWQDKKFRPQPMAEIHSGKAWLRGLDTDGAPRREPLVLVVEDQVGFSPGLTTICEFLGIQLEQTNSHRDLPMLLKTRKPMAIFCELDGSGQDGCHVMKVVAGHDRTLPILLVTGDDPSLQGAAQAVEEIFNLTGVQICEEFPVVGSLVEFLFSAGRKGRCLSLLPG